MDAVTLRRYYAELVVPGSTEQRSRLVEAFAAIPRERYLGPGPWRAAAGDGRYISTPSSDATFLYQDHLFALDEAREINNGLPSAHAMWLAALAPREGEHIVHVGAGTGYYTAVLADLVGTEGAVTAYEIHAGLAASAGRNLGERANVRVVAASAIDTTLPACDAVYVNAAVTTLPATWLDALQPGGRLLAPLTPRNGYGAMLLVTRRASPTALDARVVSGAKFTPCVGGTTDADSTRLAAAFDKGGAARVRSLRRSGTPDAGCWYAADDWWLSSEAPL